MEDGMGKGAVTNEFGVEEIDDAGDGALPDEPWVVDEQAEQRKTK